MKTMIRTATLIGLLFLSACEVYAADNARAEKVFKSLIAAQTAGDYDAFIADANDAVRAALTKTQFEAASNFLNKRTSGGFETTLLGELNHQGYQVFLFRLRFKDGGDDILGTLSLKDDKVGGIFFK